jgi:hypothetical protein
MGGEQMGSNRAAVSMRVLSERLVGNYEIVATKKETEKLPLNELQEWSEIVLFPSAIATRLQKEVLVTEISCNM